MIDIVNSDVSVEERKSDSYFPLLLAKRDSIELQCHRVLLVLMRLFGLSNKAQAEVVLHFREFCRTGSFRYSVMRYEDWAGQPDRVMLSDFYRQLERIGLVQTIKPPAKDRNCTTRIFILKGYQRINRTTKKPANSLLNSSGGGHVVQSVLGGARGIYSCFSSRRLRSVSLSGGLLLDRSTSWVKYCLRRKLPLRLDEFGATIWGQAVRRGLSSVVVPQITDIQLGLLNSVQREWYSAYLQGLETDDSSSISRVKGRVYHALTSCPKSIRRRILMRYKGELRPTVTVDMHATYWCLLVAMLGPSSERDELMGLLQSKTFYTSMQALDTSIVPSEIKVETQRQCLFWRDPRESERPLWVRFQTRFPGLASLIQRLRQAHGVSGLSDLLMHRESRLFIDRALVAIDRLGIPCLPFHDALTIPDIEAERVKQLLSDWAEESLGFIPAFAAK